MRQLGWLLPSAADLDRWPQFRDRHRVLTHKGRVAIALACRQWGIGKGDEALVPAYNCGSEVDPIVSCGARVVLFRVDDKAKIDVQDVYKRATARTRLVYITHYFGWPQQIGELVSWCRQRAIHVLEDCALCLFSAGPQGPLGAIGDAAIFSFPKTLAVPDGGALVSDRPLSADALEWESPPSKEIFRETLPLVKRGLLRTLEKARLYSLAQRHLAKSWRRRADAAASLRASEGLPDMPASFYFDPGMSNWGISSLAQRFMSQVDMDEVVSRRRNNYVNLEVRLTGIKGVRPLFSEIPHGVCPLAFPVCVDDRPKWIARLTQAGIAAIPWWAGYHRGLDWSGVQEARFLKDHVMALPIHQDLDDEHMAYIADCARQMASE